MDYQSDFGWHCEQHPCNVTGTSCHHFLWGGNDSFESRRVESDRQISSYFKRQMNIKHTKSFSRFCLYLVLQDYQGDSDLGDPSPSPPPLHTSPPRQGKVKYVNWAEEMLDAITWNIKYISRMATTKTRVLYTKLLRGNDLSWAPGNQENLHLRSSSSPQTWCWLWLSWLWTTESVSHVFSRLVWCRHTFKSNMKWMNNRNYSSRRKYYKCCFSENQSQSNPTPPNFISSSITFIVSSSTTTMLEQMWRHQWRSTPCSKSMIVRENIWRNIVVILANVIPRTCDQRWQIFSANLVSSL